MAVTENDMNKLRTFVTDVYVWLSCCYEGNPQNDLSAWPLIPIKKELRDSAILAWKAFSAEYPWDSNRGQPLSLLEPIASTKIYTEVLVSHGLYGDQLSFKLNVVEFAATKVRARGRGVGAWRKRLIDGIDVILDSLGPTGLAGGLKELKDILAVAMAEK